MFMNFITGKCFLFCLVKWLSFDESVSLCICLLTVACNRETQPFVIFIFLLLAIRCGGKKDFRFESGSGSKFNCAARVGSDDLGYGPGSGFTLKPLQTSTLYSRKLTYH